MARSPDQAADEIERSYRRSFDLPEPARLDVISRTIDETIRHVGDSIRYSAGPAEPFFGVEREEGGRLADIFGGGRLVGPDGRPITSGRPREFRLARANEYDTHPGIMGLQAQLQETMRDAMLYGSGAIRAERVPPEELRLEELSPAARIHTVQGLMEAGVVTADEARTLLGDETPPKDEKPEEKKEPPIDIDLLKSQIKRALLAAFPGSTRRAEDAEILFRELEKLLAQLPSRINEHVLEVPLPEGMTGRYFSVYVNGTKSKMRIQLEFPERKEQVPIPRRLQQVGGDEI